MAKGKTSDASPTYEEAVEKASVKHHQASELELDGAGDASANYEASAQEIGSRLSIECSLKARSKSAEQRRAKRTNYAQMISLYQESDAPSEFEAFREKTS
eukprot:CAMPEP_0172610862 /NCGR_PEP_ID=MMETSP1068-20121228/30620_1 /TAXON_ID=35684 /ORGANISM="Pseudopedinella elastica, Strain CCMP716" /LENGTH=100 /DNA_ID=CAMNT_0013414677 /DNA_START=9 /DNA_END=307 /DNA_ORIENTATION=-